MTFNFICDLSGEFAHPVDSDYPKLLESRLFYSVLASLRLRCMIPLAVIGRTFRARFVSYQAALVSGHRFGADDRFVLFKVGSGALKSTPDLAGAIMEFIPRYCPRFAYDTCDPSHVDSDPIVARLQTALLKRASLVTCAASALAEELRPLTHAPVQVIEDTVDCLPVRPKFAPVDPVRIVWFGWMTRLRFADLATRLEKIQAAMPERRFACLVLAQDIPLEWIADLNAFLSEKSGGRMAVSHRRWNLPEAWDVIAQGDIALIPHNVEADGTARFKSHNRLSTAIRRGVFAVASPVPAYGPLAEYCWLGDDLAEGVAWALAHPDEARARIAAGQTRVNDLYGPETIGARWIEVLREFAAG